MNKIRNLVAKAFEPFATSSYSPPASWPIDWWSRGFRTTGRRSCAAVETCVSAISQTIAALPIGHFKITDEGGHELVKRSKVQKVLRKPNDYQTRTDFILNLLRGELLEGNGYALAMRDRDFGVESLHLCSPTATNPLIAEDGSVFYGLQMSAVMQSLSGTQTLIVPQRDMLHIRMQTPRHPLIGESPLLAAQMAVETSEAIQEHLSGFFNNMSRPSGFLKVPGTLKADTSEKLRVEWQSAFRGSDAGKVAVLQGGLDWVPLTMNAVDAAIIDTYKMTVADVARVYRVPLSIAGETGAATFSTTEALIRFWVNTGLGFIIEHLELALDALFQLPEDEFVAFDLDYRLRAAFPARIEALTKGILGGLFSPNEARGKEGLKRVAFGDEPRLQAQVVPLSAANQIQPAPSAPAAPPPPRALPAPEPDGLELRDGYLKILENLDHE